MVNLNLSKKKMTIFIITMLFFLLVSIYLGGIKLRYKYWHFYIHNRLVLLLDKEFSDLLNKYGKENNIASLEEKNRVGIMIKYPQVINTSYAIQLRLIRDLNRGEFLFRAEIVSSGKKAHFDTGNPPIYMEIPMIYFNRVIEKGLTDEQINRLENAAKKANWKAVGLDKSVEIKAPIVLKFNNE